MARLCTLVLLGWTVLAMGPGSLAQTGTSVSTLAPPVAVTLGQSLVPLYGPWKFQVGDSPVDPVTGEAAWAEPAFDDSAWESVDLTPIGDPHGSLAGAPVPGWGGRGHAGYSGYAWYRLRVQIQQQPGRELALAEPGNFDDAYQLFVNGKLLGGFGRFGGERPQYFYSQPMVFPLPPGKTEAAGNATTVIAFRFWASPLSALSQVDAGGLRVAPLIGSGEAAAAVNQLGWLDLVRQNAVWALTACVYSLLGVMALCLFLLNRSDRVYFWMAALFLVFGLAGWETALSAWTQSIAVPPEEWVCNVGLLPMVRFVEIMLLRAWFRLDRTTGRLDWMPWAAASMATAQAVCYAGELHLLMPRMPLRFDATLPLVSQVISLAFLLLACWLLFQGIRKFGREGWLLLPALIFSWVGWLAGQRVRILNIPTTFAPYGILVSLGQITGFMLALAMCALLVRRGVLAVQAQHRTTLELKQAQEVQQVLIPEATPQVPGFSIESVYQPAGQVGGDFFQILPAKQGGVLLCIGDVSGKGMPAAMTVSLLVGTLRTLAHYSESPGEILAAMNQRMLGRSRGGFTTCLVLLAEVDGTVTVANAGHLYPYLGGRELVVENGLPLGLLAESNYAEAKFKIRDQEQLTLVTDGVVEARAESGELFGFERTAAIAGLSAESIAAAARQFGQDDDITVLTLTRAAVGLRAAAPLVSGGLLPTLA